MGLALKQKRRRLSGPNASVGNLVLEKLELAATTVAQLVMRPVFRSLEEVQLNQHEFDSQLRLTGRR